MILASCILVDPVQFQFLLDAVTFLDGTASRSPSDVLTIQVELRGDTASAVVQLKQAKKEEEADSASD